MPRTRRQLGLAILGALADTGRSEHRENLIGREGQWGGIERKLGEALTFEERGRAGRAFDKLLADGLIQPDGKARVGPGEPWVILTDAGRTALKRGELDELDAALGRLDPRFVEMRTAAWERIASDDPDAVRQAAHEGRELLHQVFAVKPGTHKEQVKGHLEATHGTVDKDDVEFADKVVQFAVAAFRRLTPASHERGIPSRDAVRAGLEAMDTSLRLLLVRSEES